MYTGNLRRSVAMPIDLVALSAFVTCVLQYPPISGRARANVVIVIAAELLYEALLSSRLCTLQALTSTRVRRAETLVRLRSESRVNCQDHGCSLAARCIACFS